MRSMITLGIGQMEIDWGKYGVVNDHSVLFQRGDLKAVPHYCVSYSTEEPIVKMAEGFSKKLKYVKARLDLLGYNLTSIRTQFDELIQDHENHGCTVPLTFDAFYEAITKMNLSIANTVKYEVEGYANGYDLGEYAAECVLQIPEINKELIGKSAGNRFAWNDAVNDLSVFWRTLIRI